MWFYIVKVFISAVIIVAVSEVARFNATLGGLIKSLPLISLLAIIWLYLETKDVAKVSELSISTIFFVIPTIPFFFVLPALLKNGFGFYTSLVISIMVMLVCYITYGNGAQEFWVQTITKRAVM